jgi:hypothetical protein
LISNWFALVSKVLVMTGGPGVGKSTIVKAFLRIFAAKGVRFLLCAPTGRAAKRMTEATGFEAKTIHRLLEVRVFGPTCPTSPGRRRGTRMNVSAPFIARPVDEKNPYPFAQARP